MSADSESNCQSREHLPGFADLAEFISSDNHGDLAIYRRFSTLGARNIIYLQGELAFLESKLRNIDEEDKQVWLGRFSMEEQVDVLQAARDWESFVRMGKVQGSRDERRYSVVMEVRKVMKDYREFVFHVIL